MSRKMFCGLLASSAVIAAGVAWQAWSSAQQPVLPMPAVAKATRPAESPLPIKQVVLFNSGVGYFQREGEVAGNARVGLTFNVADINDLLKSMVLQDLGGGRVSTVHFDSQDPLDKILHSFALDLNANPTFGQLLNQARGEKIEVLRREKADGLAAKLTGTVVGMEARPLSVNKDKEATTEMELLNLSTGNGIESLPLTQVLAVRFLNTRLEGEFHRALEVLAAAHDTQKKSVSVGFDGQGKRKVRVGYVVERPIWKTSYRLRLEPNGKVFLQGWAIVENTSDDDWNDVRMVLVSGRPISYKMNLYEPLYVPRPTVEPALFASLRPPLYGGAMMQFDAAGKLVAGGQQPPPFNQFLGGGLNNLSGGVGMIGGAPGNVPPALPAGAPTTMMGMGGGMMGGTGTGMMGMMGMMGGGLAAQLNEPSYNRYQVPQNPFYLGSQQRLTYEQLQERRQQQQLAREEARKKGKAVADLNFKEGINSVASADDVGGYFQYAIDQKITLPRQKSAMLPIFDQTIAGTKVSIFNESVDAKHPLLGLRLKNTSGQPLTQGPITVYDDGTYAGDSRVLDLQANEVRLLSYALDQGTEIQTKIKHSRSPEIIARISGDVLIHPYQERETKTYLIKNRSPKDRLVVIEHPVRAGWSLVSATPHERTRDLYRFEVKAPAGKLSQFKVIEEQPRQEQIALTPAKHFPIGDGLSIQALSKIGFGERFDLKVVTNRLHARFVVRDTRTYFFQNSTKMEHVFHVDHLVRPQWKLAGIAADENKGPKLVHFDLVVPAGKTVSHAVTEEQVKAEQLSLSQDPGRYSLGLGIEVQPVLKAAPPRLTDLKVVKGVLKARYKSRQHLTYFARNNADRDRLFVFEHLVRPDWRRVDGDEEQLGPSLYRFELKVPAGKTASHVLVEERGYAAPDEPLKSATADSVQAFLTSAVAGADVKAALAKMQSMSAKLTEARGQLADFEKQLKTVSDDQSRLRANLAVIPQSAEPYKQFLQKFVTQEREIESFQRQVRQLQASVQKQQKEYDAFTTGASAE